MLSKTKKKHGSCNGKKGPTEAAPVGFWVMIPSCCPVSMANQMESHLKHDMEHAKWNGNSGDRTGK